MKPVSIDARISAVEFMINRALSPGAKVSSSVLEETEARARQAISARIWLRDDPEAQTLMRAQAERKRAAEGARL